MTIHYTTRRILIFEQRFVSACKRYDGNEAGTMLLAQARVFMCWHVGLSCSRILAGKETKGVAQNAVQTRSAA